MARTVGQVVAAAREILQDEATPYRWSADSLSRYVSEAISEARRVRPDMFLTTLRDDLPYYTSADSATEIPLPDSYFPQIVNYVAGRADLREDTYAVDGRAMALTNAFGLSLIGGGNR